MLASLLQAESPSVLYLTWIHDPTTTMTIQWHTSCEEGPRIVYYRPVGELQWQHKEGVYFKIPQVEVWVHTLELVDLTPGHDYEFYFLGKQERYVFRTMAQDLQQPVRFVIGGDAYYYLKTFRKMNQQIAEANPDFVVVGGDIAYTHGRTTFFKGKNWQIRRWQTFFKNWKRQMVTAEGRMIPILPVVGNHDVRALSLRFLLDPPLFYELFAFPEKNSAYRVLDFSTYLSLILLDTDHTHHIEGEQTAWLKQVLSQRENVPYKMAAYHVGAYPSVYPYQGGTSKKIRSEWCPLFEKYHLSAAFEHHNHAYKRTYPIRAEKIDPSGVVYMGDGSWGVPPRQPKNKKKWYLAHVQKINAVCLITLHDQKALIQGLSDEGHVIDEVTLNPMSPLAFINEAQLLIH